MKKKGIKKEQSDIEYEKLFNKIIELKEDVLEEFDMLELIEDSIKDVFDCDLNCATCSREEQGQCMQNFKKGNIYWIRKIAQDEEMIKNVVIKMEGMMEALIEMMEKQREFYSNKCLTSEKLKDRKEQIKNRLKDKHGYNFYS